MTNAFDPEYLVTTHLKSGDRDVFIGLAYESSTGRAVVVVHRDPEKSDDDLDRMPFELVTDAIDVVNSVHATLEWSGFAVCASSCTRHGEPVSLAELTALLHHIGHRPEEMHRMEVEPICLN